MQETVVSLLTTKLYIPSPRPNLAPRPELMLRLDETLRLQHALTLVSAKAGSGKTTAVSQWLHRRECAAAWLSLDTHDDEPRRFLRYLIAALCSLGVEVGQGVLGQLESPRLAEPDALLVTLVNDLAALSASFALVIDDYYLIQDEWIHQAITFLAEHQPPQMHLILVTRSDPPLPLARLRARGQLVEVRDRDLRFTETEVAWLANEMLELELPAKAVSTLEQRTEGWAVGVQMALLAMQARLPMHRDDRPGALSAFVEAFGGTYRYILDYLMEEVLGQQPQAIQDFLIETCILERMCGPLCDAVRSGPHSKLGGDEAVLHDGQEVLAYLERANLFVTPLDDERRWYRYHHLFADLLHSVLRQQRPADQIRELHRRASRWHQEEGFLEAAVRHAMAAQDFERVASMIDENIVRLLSSSEAPVLLGWIEELPEQVVRNSPWIEVWRAYTLALSGRPGEADSLLEGVERRIDRDMPRAAEYMGYIAAIRSYTANLWGDTEGVIEMANLAESVLPKEHLIARGMANYALAVTYFADDDMNSTIKASLKMLEIGRKLDRMLMVVTALCDLASAKKVQGKLGQSQEYYDRARRWMAERNGLDSRGRCVYEVGWADSLLQWNQLDAAYEHAATGITYCQRFGAPSEMTWGYVTLMRVLQAQGDTEGALEALYDAEQVLQAHRVRQALRVELETKRVALWLAVGDVDAASRWATCCEGGSEREQIALARLRLAQGRASDALHVLERQRVLAETGGRTGRLLEILGLQAVVLDAQGQSSKAEAVLSRALALARPERSVRVFLDLGSPLFRLLERLAAQGTEESAPSPALAYLLQAYTRDLLDAFQQGRSADKSRATEAASPSLLLAETLLDPLTDRELEVLRLLAEGLSNKTIAGKLIVAPSTIKQHLKNIYAKLDVHSRTQAVARGRELDLL